MALVILNFVIEFPNKGREPICQKWNGEICGPPPEVIPNQSSDEKKPKRTFPFEFRPKFPESLA